MNKAVLVANEDEVTDIFKLPEKEQSSILLTLDHFIKAAKISLL